MSLKQYLKDYDKTMEAFRWCVNNGITIYPVCLQEFYMEGKRKINKVRLEVNINGSKIQGKKIYKQDQELNDKISELYLHYRERAS
jgi:hypothetical protein